MTQWKGYVEIWFPAVVSRISVETRQSLPRTPMYADRIHHDRARDLTAPDGCFSQIGNSLRPPGTLPCRLCRQRSCRASFHWGRGGGPRCRGWWQWAILPSGCHLNRICSARSNDFRSQGRSRVSGGWSHSLSIQFKNSISSQGAVRNLVQPCATNPHSCTCYVKCSS
jgi:hypothetical protein